MEVESSRCVTSKTGSETVWKQSCQPSGKSVSAFVTNTKDMLEKLNREAGGQANNTNPKLKRRVTT
eukprot:CAMPEP_0183414120 /NCGR_PEP_ID=MMETSP0370-20130417/22181_1 /TAXON_ID=268820 /ORGANISM="Peridinium aciculiferum, Strain PAER-2" /LENGTH=65 /DNA_ID=CAMNT_0025597415 /DNA_START=120 /DNA_END=317 /DNA_ORIENTATION=-